MALKALRRVAVTGGAGQIAYSLLFRIASGELLGEDQPVALHILELPVSLDALRGVVMELEDCAFPLLHSIKIGADPEEVFSGVHYAFLVGAKPRGPGMERKDLLMQNGKIFVEQGRALNAKAAPDLITLVVGNPCNTNCLIALKNAPNKNKERFFAMTMLDENRARQQLAHRAKTLVEDVENVAIWGNHSSTQVPDFVHAKIKEKPLLQTLNDRNWLEKEFFSIVQKRGAEVIQARGKSSAASAAHAALKTMQALVFPTPKGSFFSVAKYAKGNSYGIDEDLVFSFPCQSKGNGEVEIVSGLSWDTFLKDKIKLTEQELREEKELVKGLL